MNAGSKRVSIRKEDRRKEEVRSSRLHFGFSTGVGIALIDVGPTQQIVESADPVPSVTIAFQDNAVFAGFVSPTVVLSKKINQQLPLCSVDARIHENLTRLFVKIV